MHSGRKFRFIVGKVLLKTDHTDLFTFQHSYLSLWAGHVARVEEMRNTYRVLVRIPEGKRPLVKHRCRWEENIKMILRETVWEGVDWIHLTRDWNQWLAE
jgi:hypothetical protein